jgi:hypothetical protein
VFCAFLMLELASSSEPPAWLAQDEPAPQPWALEEHRTVNR